MKHKSIISLAFLSLFLSACGSQSSFTSTTSLNSSSSLSSTTTTSAEEYLPVAPIEPDSKVYKVTFLDNQGEVILTLDVKEGEDAIVPDDINLNRADSANYYLFTGWDQSLENITTDLYVHAIYETIPFDGNYAFALNDALGYSLMAYKGDEQDPLIPDHYNGHVVNAIGTSAFSGNRNIVNVTLPETIVSIGANAFYDCEALETISLPNNLLYIGDQAFYYCLSLKEITFPDKLEKIGSNAFQQCQEITSVTLPDSLTYLGTQAFMGCMKVTSFSVGKSLRLIGSAPFYGMPSLANFSISEENKYFTFDGTGLYYFIDEQEENEDGTMTSYYYNGLVYMLNVPSAQNEYVVKDGVETIGNYSMAYVSNIKKIVIPSSVTKDEGFAYVGSGIEEIDYPVDGNITFSAGLFSNATSLESFTLPSTMTVIPKWGFENTKSLQKITVPEGIVRIEDEAFFGSGITELTLPSSLVYLGSHDTIEDGGFTSVFNSCANLSKVDMSDTKVTEITNNCFSSTDISEFAFPSGITSIGEYAFQHCAFSSLDLPDSITNLGAACFDSNTKLKTVDLPDNSKLKSLPSRAFWGCSSLESAVIHEGVTTINMQSFYNCTSLDTIYLPSTLKTVGSNAITNCPLTDIYFSGTQDEFLAINISENNNFDPTAHNIHFI